MKLLSPKKNKNRVANSNKTGTSPTPPKRVVASSKKSPTTTGASPRSRRSPTPKKIVTRIPPAPFGTISDFNSRNNNNKYESSEFADDYAHNYAADDDYDMDAYSEIYNEIEELQNERKQQATTRTKQDNENQNPNPTTTSSLTNSSGDSKNNHDESSEATRDLVRKFIANIWNRGELDLISEVCSSNIRFNGSGDGDGGMDRVGHDGFARMVATIHNTLSEYHCEIHSMVVEGDKAFCRLRFSGVHNANLLGFEPTHQRLTWMGATEFTIKDNRIIKVWEIGDMKSLEHQLVQQQQ